MASITDGKFWSDLLKKILKIILTNMGFNTKRKSHVQHVVPLDKDWAVKGEGNTRYSGIFDTQAQAIKRAKQIARNYKSDVVIHRRDGTIRDRINYD